MGELDEQATIPGDLLFGEELRKQREIRGISLKEIADATKISKRYLELIEKNEFAHLPAPVFTRGFVREYARYLGLDPEEMVSRYESLVRFEQVQKEADEAIEEKRIRALGRPGRILGWVIAIGLVAAAAGGAWLYFQRARPAQAESEAPVAEAEVRAAAPTTGEPATQTAAPEPSSSLSLSLSIRALEDTWIVLDADGKKVFGDVVPRGETMNFQAERQFRFQTIGNAGGLVLTLNGVELPRLGESGRVIRDRVLDRESLAQVRGGGSRP